MSATGRAERLTPTQRQRQHQRHRRCGGAEDEPPLRPRAVPTAPSPAAWPAASRLAPIAVPTAAPICCSVEIIVLPSDDSSAGSEVRPSVCAGVPVSDTPIISNLSDPTLVRHRP